MRAYEIAGAVLAGLILAAIVFLVAFDRLTCSLRTESESQSPDARFVAKLQESDCGALTRFETYVTLSQSRPRLGMRFLGHSRADVLTLEESSSHLSLLWGTLTSLVVDCTGCAPKDVHIWMSSWNQVSITYKISN